MINNISELEKQIAEKNCVLDSLKRTPNPNDKEMGKIENELDKLLYMYYKSLKDSSCNNEADAGNDGG